MARKHLAKIFYWVLVLLIVLVMLFSLASFYQQRDNGYQTVQLTQGDLIKIVNVSGRLIPQDELFLTAESNGIIKKINYEVGDQVLTGDALLEIDGQEIDLAISGENSKLQAVLSQVEVARVGLATEELLLKQIQERNQNQSSQQEIAERKMWEEIRQAFELFDNTLAITVAQFFNEPNSYSTNFKFLPQGYNVSELKNKVEKNYKNLLVIKDDWNKFLARNDQQIILQNTALVYQNLESLRLFLVDFANIVNQITVEDLSQSDLTSSPEQYKNEVATIRNNLTQAVAKLHSTEDSLKVISVDESVQLAKVETALANLTAAEAEVQAVRSSIGTLQVKKNKNVILSPVDGIIYRQNLKVGQQVLLGGELLAIMSPQLQLEVYVPELNIIGIAVGNNARFHLDADENQARYLATVAKIDPAQTIHDGVATYRVLLNLVELGENKPTLKSGMTINLEIITSERSGVNLLPARVIIDEGGDKKVKIIVDNDRGEKKVVEKTIVVGEKDSFGYVEVISGVEREDQVWVNF